MNRKNFLHLLSFVFFIAGIFFFMTYQVTVTGSVVQIPEQASITIKDTYIGLALAVVSFLLFIATEYWVE